MVALAAVKGYHTLAELAAQFDAYPNHIQTGSGAWSKDPRTFLSATPSGFGTTSRRCD